MILSDQSDVRAFVTPDGSICIEQASPLGGYPDLIELSPERAAELGADLLRLSRNCEAA